jgi:hypothetical protein
MGKGNNKVLKNICTHVLHRATAKLGAVLIFTWRFGHEDFIERKSLLNVLETAWTWLFTVFNFKNIFSSNKVTALSKSVKLGK